MVHRDIRVFQQRVALLIVMRENRNTDTGGGKNLAGLGLERIGEHRFDLVGDRGDFLYRRDVFNQHREFVAA
ncbi:hypothetical protein D3C83_228030 [compost metagenome]